MAHLVQLSDLHLLANPVEQAGIFDALVAALHAHYAGRARRADLLAITGDVFDTATVEPREATRHLVGLLDRIREALGGEVPTVVIPGNHDRRQNGLVGPHRPELFVAVREALGSAAWVHGCRTPFLAGSRVEVLAPTAARPRDAPARVELALDATTRYRHTGGLCRTVAEDVRVHGPGAASFEWLSHMNRYATGLAFASATDLGTGLETPMRLRRDIDAGTVELWHPDCAPRTLRRVYWPLHD